MHVKHAVHIGRPVGELSAALLESPSRWFPRSIGVHIAGIPVRKRVHLLIGLPESTSSWAEIPVWWQPTFGRKLLPVMNGKVELAPTGTAETRLTVSGMYEPPLGKLGEQLDNAFMHNIAQGTVRELAETLAKRLGA